MPGLLRHRGIGMGGRGGRQRSRAEPGRAGPGQAGPLCVEGCCDATAPTAANKGAACPVEMPMTWPFSMALGASASARVRAIGSVRQRQPHVMRMANQPASQPGQTRRIPRGRSWTRVCKGTGPGCRAASKIFLIKAGEETTHVAAGLHLAALLLTTPWLTRSYQRRLWGPQDDSHKMWLKLRTSPRTRRQRVRWL